MYVTNCNTTSPLFMKMIQKIVIFGPTGIQTVWCSSGTTRLTYGLFYSSVRINYIQIICIIRIRLLITGSNCIWIRKNNQVFAVSSEGAI